jgi:hypothetical protein
MYRNHPARLWNMCWTLFLEPQRFNLQPCDNMEYYSHIFYPSIYGDCILLFERQGRSGGVVNPQSPG